MAHYPAPLDKLLTLGEPDDSEKASDYQVMGLGPEHIPDLIRMATDPALNEGDSNTPDVWAPLHAWRALGRLHAETAVEPLLGLLDDAEKRGDDWLLEDLPEVLGEIGPGAIPALAAYLADQLHGVFARAAAARGLTHGAELHPEAREQCVEILSRELEAAAQNDPRLNGLLIAYLLDLHATEAAPVMERALAGGHVDETVAGNWEYVQYELGLRTKPPSFRMPTRPPRFGPPIPDFAGESVRPDRKAKAKAKKKRKEAAKARKRNRKRR